MCGPGRCSKGQWKRSIIDCKQKHTGLGLSEYEKGAGHCMPNVPGYAVLICAVAVQSNLLHSTSPVSFVKSPFNLPAMSNDTVAISTIGHYHHVVSAVGPKHLEIAYLRAWAYVAR